MTPSEVEFFQGFEWAVSAAFSETLGGCRFERGDVLYDTRGGSQQCIQVKSPAQGAGRASDQAGVFEENWKSEVLFTVFKITDKKYEKIREVTTTQGRLFMLLWKGDWNVLKAETDPPVPSTWFDLSRECERVASQVKKNFVAAQRMEKPNIWIMAYDPTHYVSRTKYETVKKRLAQEFEISEHMFSPEDLGSGSSLIVPTLRYACFATDLGASARITDALKEVLYKPSSDKKTDVDRFRLSTHGAFIPSHIQEFGDLVTVSFAHSKGRKNVFYRYRLCKPRLANVPPKLRDFLTSMVVDCPNHFFNDPPFCSSLKLTLPIECNRVRDHKLTDLAGESFDVRKDQRYKSEHENVQMYLIEKDPETIAVEVPVWAEWDELRSYSKFITPSGTLTGHIDLLRCSSGVIEIWDYKPAAFQETCAASQVFFYGVLLSKRTGLPLSRFQCGYFGPSDAFIFNPEEAAHVVLGA